MKLFIKKHITEYVSTDSSYSFDWSKVFNNPDSDDPRLRMIKQIVDNYRSYVFLPDEVFEDKVGEVIKPSGMRKRHNIVASTWQIVINVFPKDDLLKNVRTYEKQLCFEPFQSAGIEGLRIVMPRNLPGQFNLIYIRHFNKLHEPYLLTGREWGIPLNIAR